MKITMNELLKMVKDCKAPKKIKYKNCEYNLYDNKSYLSTDKTRLFDHIYFSDLNAEVEILEEEKKIPEKLDHLIGYDINQFDDLKEYVEITTDDLFGKINKVIDTLNQVIDFLKSKGE